jgi:hypothetical protein
MKLVSFVSANRPGYGLVKDNGVVDLGRRLGDRLPTLRALSPQVPSPMRNARRAMHRPTFHSTVWSLPR